jgi:prepilin-type N-terminal cleavage/methylation domain-containing protein
MNREFSKEKAVSGFSLVELLTAMAVLAILSLLLLGISNQVGNTWASGQSANQNRTKARAALEFIGRELQAAFLSPDSSDSSLQFVINPPTVTLRNRDSVFWQAPVATDRSRGDLAVVGYFVRWRDGKCSLCRFFANPSDSASHLVDQYPDTTGWVSDSLLDTTAPADKANHYAGLFLENVAGLWIDAFARDGTPYAGDSRASGNALPAWVDIAIVLLDNRTAERLREGPDLAAVSAASSVAASADVFVSGLPSSIRSGARLVRFRVALLNNR